MERSKKAEVFRIVALVGILCLVLYLVVLLGIEKSTHQAATIGGKVYFDTNQNSALDYGDVPADGVKIVLQKVERVSDTPALSTIRVDEVAVENGEYRFKVFQKGEYLIDIVYQWGPYQLQWDATYFFGNQSVNVQKGRGETIVGPTILLVKGGMG